MIETVGGKHPFEISSKAIHLISHVHIAHKTDIVLHMSTFSTSKWEWL
jgi:hypothetical protein